tara:strand:- start:858 stop:1241 length:384 start_codon:yes stop_codon:yes gene_type:complete
MGFKLGNEKRKFRTPDNTPIFRKNLDNGVDAEANNDGSIYVDSNIPIDSARYKRAIRHEKKHIEDMETGRAGYGENWVMWEGDIFFRKTINGEKFIDGPAGRLPEGHPDHPWEQSAIAAEKNKDYGI